MSEVLIAGRPLEGRTGHEAGRALLAELYAQITGQPLPEIRVTDRGKPYFPDSPLHFSITHTPAHAFCALAEHPVGIDAEEMDRAINPRLAEKILSPGELARYEAAADKRAALLRLWVLKEALAKLTGRGWGNYLRETDFDPQDPRIRVLAGCYVAVLTQDR